MALLDPMWTQPLTISKRGMDPLGLDRASDRITNEMLTGITTQTNQARYYSFYVWNVYNINKGANVAEYNQFRRLFYNHEREFMMACIAHKESNENPGGDHSNILGSTQGEKRWKDSQNNVRMNFSHLGNRLGGYGYYYQASIANLGLTDLNSSPQVQDVVTQLGEKLAEAFGKAIQNCIYIKSYQGAGDIPKDVLLDYGRKGCLCLLSDQNSPDRDLLREILFALNPKAKGNSLHTRRRDTLALILYHLLLASQQGIDLDDQTHLDACYFKQISIAGKVLHIEHPRTFDDVLERRRLFRANDYFAFACECYLSAFLKLLDANYLTGISFDQFLASLNGPNSVKILSDTLGKNFTATSLDEIKLHNVIVSILSQVLGDSVLELATETSERFNAKCDLSSVFSEQAIVKNLENLFAQKKFDVNSVTIDALLLLSVLYIRFYHKYKKPDAYWRWLVHHTGNDLSVLRFVLDVGQKLRESGFTVLDFLKWLIGSYIVNQALVIYQQKSTSIYTRPMSWFHPDGNVFRKDRDYDPGFRSSRFLSCVNIVKDLGLAKWNGNLTEPTPDGIALLKSLGIEVS